MIVREFFRIVRKLNEEEGLTVLVVEQDARIALRRRARVRPRGRPRRADRDERRAPRRRVDPPELPRLLMLAAAFTDFMQQVVSGLASGGIYALLALALVIIHLDGVINFAQGEMATLDVHRVGAHRPPRLELLAGVRRNARPVVRRRRRDPHSGHPPVERGSVLRIVIVTIGLLVAINGFIVWEWSGEPQQLQSPFGTETYDIGGVVVAAHDIGTIAVALGIVLLLWGSSSSRRWGSRCGRRR